MATKSTLVVNLYAGPGAGKTTCAWLVAGELKKLGVVTEYVPEYAKELVWDGRTDLLDGNYKNQTAVLAEQNRRIERLRGKVDVIVTDSPLLMSSMYAKENVEQFEQLAFSMYNRCDNFNLFITRGDGFEQEGRIHSLQESKKIDEEIKGFLDEHGVYYGTYEHNTLDMVVRNIQASLHNLQKGVKPYLKQPPQSPTQQPVVPAPVVTSAPEAPASQSETVVLSANKAPVKVAALAPQRESIKLTEAIKRDIRIPQLAEKLGYHLVPHGGKGMFHLKEHDSLVISADGRLFSWNSTGQQGSVIDFAMATLDLTKDDALRMLRGVLDDPEFAPKPGTTLHPTPKKPVTFKPPAAGEGQWKRLYAYLQSRGISRSVINMAVKEKLVYQDVRGKLLNYLAFSAKFYQYSPRNLMMIYAQNPHATFTAAKGRYLRMGYRVKPGEKGIEILRPQTKEYFERNGYLVPVMKATNAEKAKLAAGKLEVVQKTYFDPSDVYDISQTTCPVEDYPKVYDKGYNSEQHAALFEQLKELSELSGVPVEIKDLASISLNGFFDRSQNTITLNHLLQDSERLDTMCHEYAHALLHRTTTQSSAVAEFEAQCLANMLESRFGLPTSENNKEYMVKNLKEAQKDPKFKLDVSLARVQKQLQYIDKRINLSPQQEEELELEPQQPRSKKAPEPGFQPPHRGGGRT